MKVLVIGSGAREHAILWKLAQSPKVRQLFAAPGNAGTGSLATNLPIAAADLDALSWAAHEHGIDLTVVGPEAPLAAGIVDRFRKLGLWVFGPTRAAARIEASKVFAKELMERHGIPTARGRVFDSYDAARRYIQAQELPLVVKADGLAAGKGVTVAPTCQEAFQALDDCMVRRVFGSAGDRVIVEECLRGREVSVFAFTDGTTLSSLAAACDYKRAYDNDRGPNTGGMGSYSPPEFWTPQLAEEVRERILQPTLQALAAEGSPYTGVLYAGLMLTGDGPRVLEFNCRLGDPEAQVILPRLETDLIDIIQAVLQGNLASVDVRWEDNACVGVVVASEGYPGEHRKGLPISGLDGLGDGSLVFHAGTASTGDSVITTGGRVLTVMGLGRDLAQARQRAYSAVEHIAFPGAFCRRDIAAVD